MADRFDPYAILQVSQDADQDVLQAAYRSARPTAPSRPLRRSRRQAKMAQLNAAWETARRPRATGRLRPDPPRPGDPRLDRPDRRVDAAPTDAARLDAAQSAARSASAPPSRSPPPRPRPGGRGPNGEGGAGRRPATRRGRSSTSAGTSAGRSARSPGSIPGYLEWLDKQPQGSRLHDEIDRTLRARGSPDGPRTGPSGPSGRAGLGAVRTLTDRGWPPAEGRPIERRPSVYSGP